MIRRWISQLIICATMLFSCAMTPLYAAERISVEIGSHTVVFIVPDDNAQLTSYYKNLISVYANSENKNLEMAAKLQEYINLTDELSKKVGELTVAVDTANESLTTYTTLVNKAKIYVGPIAGFGFSTNPLSTTYTVGGRIDYVKPRFAFGLQIPISLSTSDTSFSMGIVGSITFSL